MYWLQTMYNFNNTMEPKEIIECAIDNDVEQLIIGDEGPYSWMEIEEERKKQGANIQLIFGMHKKEKNIEILWLLKNDVMKMGSIVNEMYEKRKFTKRENLVPIFIPSIENSEEEINNTVRFLKRISTNFYMMKNQENKELFIKTKYDKYVKYIHRVRFLDLDGMQASTIRRKINEEKNFKENADQFLKPARFLKEEGIEETQKEFKTINGYIKMTDETQTVEREMEFWNKNKIEKMVLPKEWSKFFDKDIKIPDSIWEKKKIFLLCQNAGKGFIKRYGRKNEKALAQLKRELTVVVQLGFYEYFLMVEDFVSYARKNNIEIGTRGSVVGSVLAYSLDITSIEPIENGLKFERFLNESRVDKPDIDLDIQKSKLEEMIQYAKKKYGIENVAKIITFTSFGFRSAVISIRNVYGIKTTIEDRIPKIETSLEDFYKTEMFENLKMWMNINGYSKILEEARMIADKVQTLSVHPAGLVISSDIKDIPTITKDGEKIILVTINNKQLEKLGFVKFDFLSSNILANIYETRKIINYFEPIDFKDPEIYKVLWTNNSYGLFQMKSWGIKEFAKKIQPQNLGDVMDVIAMYRPGPKDQIDAYIKNRREKNFLLVDENGEKLKETIILESILKRTNAILIYQEQVMEISEVWAGFSKVESDNFRKYISAKEREKLQFQIDLFKERSKELGRDEYTTEQLISLIIKFANYGFPKSHAASYAKVTLETAFLKRYYPKQFLVVLANADIRDKKKKIGELVVEMKRNGIKVIPPTFKDPAPLFELKNDEIYYGFRAMVGIGEKDIEKIKNIDVRKIENIEQLLAEKSMDVRVKEIFVKAGCLDHIADRWEILVQLRREKSEYKENKNELEKKKIYKKWEKDILRI